MSGYCTTTHRFCEKWQLTRASYAEIDIVGDGSWADSLADTDCKVGMVLNGGSLAVGECGVAILEDRDNSGAKILESMTGENDE